jgi:uncharacterized protein YabN with tetrapyrrole methylase and pyrophosphatase domain
MIKRMKQKEQKKYNELKCQTLINVAKVLPSKMRINPLYKQVRNLHFFCRDIEALYILENDKVTYHYHARMSIDISRRVHSRIRDRSPIRRHHRMLKNSTKLCLR